MVWILSILPLISNSSRTFFLASKTVPNAPRTIGITVIFTFHSLVSSLVRSNYLDYFTPSEFFSPPSLSGGLLLKSDWQQVLVSRTLLSILVDFDNAVIWMVSSLLISNSSRPSLWGDRVVFSLERSKNIPIFYFRFKVPWNSKTYLVTSSFFLFNQY